MKIFIIIMFVGFFDLNFQNSWALGLTDWTTVVQIIQGPGSSPILKLDNPDMLKLNVLIQVMDD